jgi:UDP-N-acetylglucosamine 2-epimerase (hydrolysing)
MKKPDLFPRRKILFLTGTRADFGKLKPLMEEVENSEDFECNIFVTGMHTCARYGSTYEEVKKSGFNNIFLYINQMASNSSAMDIVLASTIQGLAYYVRELLPDMIIVHGDRIEALAGAIVGALNNIYVAHVEGGEVSGTIDELIRHAISKLAHMHFVANGEAKQRLIQMGELPDSIFPIGSPDIDVMLSNTLPSLAAAKSRYGIEFEDYALFMYHPVTTELDHLRHNIEEISRALAESGWNFVVIYPNNDPGSEIILENINQLIGNKNFKLFPSLRFEYFLTLLKNSKAIIGNSSAGVREAPVYGIPTINIGNRQNNRFNYFSIINVCERYEEILTAMQNLPRSSIPSLHFGRGNSAQLFIELLKKREVWEIPHQKQFIDLPVINTSHIK